jgi:hypothetical protein
MSKINKKYTVSAKGIMYIEDGIISVENENTGELIQVADLLEDFNEKECSLTVAYAEDYE